jgi:hypothetical protein
MQCIVRIVAIAIVGQSVNFGRAAEFVVHWTNNASQDVLSTLTSGNVFTTNFKGTNDVQVSLVSGAVPDLYDEFFGAPNPGTNPSWVTDYVGSVLHGTGDGTAGVWRMLEPSRSASQLQFDFVIPLVAGDRLLIADVDNTETYQFEAYKRVGASYASTPVTGWQNQPHSGQTGLAPDSRWPTWSNNFITGSGNALFEPLNVLRIDGTVDRIVFTNQGNPDGTPALQFASTNFGDYNYNGVVDAADFVIWRKSLGTTYTLGDYEVWRAHFGNTVPSGSQFTGVSSVPEPATMWMAYFGFALIATVRLRRTWRENA